MSPSLERAADPEGRRGSHTRLREGGRDLKTPENRPAAATATNPQPSPFSVSHLRGALQG
jgi:hypothetical protein